MSTPAAWSSSWRLLRPAQWPILSAQLAVGAALALGAQPDPPGSHPVISWPTLIGAWLCWVVLLNGGTLAFNSAFDRDTGPVAYLADPPLPPPGLHVWALLCMIAGAAGGAVAVSMAFGAVTAACVILSWLYSHPRTRWKGQPGLDLAVNMAGYGFGTTAAGILAGWAAIGRHGTGGGDLLWIGLGFGLLFGSLYPFTQIYQYDQDKARGDRTLTTALGVARSLELSLVLGILAVAALWRGTVDPQGAPPWLLAAALALWLGHPLVMRIRWQGRDTRSWERAMYRSLALWAAVDVACVITWLQRG